MILVERCETGVRDRLIGGGGHILVENKMRMEDCPCTSNNNVRETSCVIGIAIFLF